MSTVVSDGDLIRIERAWGPRPASVSLYAGLTQDYATIWRTQPNVRFVIRFLARNIAHLGLHVYQRVSQTDRVRLTDHPLARTLARPNPYTTTYRLISSLVHDRGIFDNAFWLKVAEGDRIGLIRLPPQRVAPVGDNWLAPEGYTVTGTKGKVTYDAAQVVHFRGHNPDDPRWGVSPIETLRRILAEDVASGSYREQFWNNAARMSGYIKRPSDAPKWSPTARERFRAQWQAQWAGDTPNAGGTPVLEEGMEFVEAGFSARESQYLEARKLTREEVAFAFHIQPAMVGLLEHANFANIREQHKALYQDTLGPDLEDIQQDIELQLLPDFGDVDGVYVEFNLAEKLKGTFEEQATVMQTMVGAPVMTRNEGRSRLNLPEIDGGDQLVTPLNVLIGGQASPRDSAPTPGQAALPSVGVKARDDEIALRDQHVAKHQEVLDNFFARQRAELLAEVGAKARRWYPTVASSTTHAVKAAVADVFDRPRWDRELGDDLYAAAVATAAEFGSAAAAEVGGGGWNIDGWPGALPYLREVADIAAQAVNDATARELEDALAADDPRQAVRDLFDGAVAARAQQLAMTRTTQSANFGRVEGGISAGARSKTWRTTSRRPRASHSAISGQSVPIHDRFGNGGKWPGDPSLPVDEVAGCQCIVDIHTTG